MTTSIPVTDLTQRPPRGFRVRIGGLVILARMLKELATGKGDWEILQWIQANCTTPRQHWEIEAFSSFMERYAPDSDPETLAVFAGYFKNFPEGREDLKTWFEVLELDDYVSYGGNALCPELEKTDCWRRRLNLRVWRNCSGEDDASE